MGKEFCGDCSRDTDLPDICNNSTLYETEDQFNQCCYQKFVEKSCFVLLDDYCKLHENYTEAAKGEEFKFRYCEELNPHWPHHHALNFMNFFAVLSQGLAMLGLCFIALPYFIVEDKQKKVTAHPSGSIAKIAILQATVYFYMIFGNLPGLCRVTQYSYLEPLTSLRGSEEQLLDEADLGIDASEAQEYAEKDTNFKLIHGLSMELIGFMGLIQLILSFFLMVDMAYTWKHPIKYISIQTQMNHYFEIAAKLGQVVIFVGIAIFPGTQNYAFGPIAVSQVILMLGFAVYVYFKELKGKKTQRLLWLILKRYALPQICFVMLTIDILINMYFAQNMFKWKSFSWWNCFSPMFTFVLLVVKWQEPQTQVMFRQIGAKCCKCCRCCIRPKISKQEWKDFAKDGEQLDTVLAQSIVIESIYLTLRGMIMEAKDETKFFYQNGHSLFEDQQRHNRFAEQKSEKMNASIFQQFFGGYKNHTELGDDNYYRHKDYTINFQMQKDVIKNELTKRINDDNQSNSNQVPNYSQNETERRLKELEQFRATQFRKEIIQISRIEVQFFHKFMKDTHDEDHQGQDEDQFILEHLSSFKMYENFDQIMQTARKVELKYSRVNLKFETFDFKFQLAFSDKQNILDMRDIIEQFKIYYLQNVRATPKNLTSSSSEMFHLAKKSERPGSFILKPFRIYQLDFRWIFKTKIIIYDQSKHLVPFNSKNVLFKFQINGNDPSPKMSRQFISKKCGLDFSTFITQEPSSQELNKRLKHFRKESQKNGNLSDCSFKREFMFNTADLINLQKSNFDFIDFTDEDIIKFKSILRNDLEFFKNNDIINYSLQMIIELNDPPIDQNLMEGKKTSFFSQNNKYVYHFGLIDYSQKHQSLNRLQRRWTKDAETYKNLFEKTIHENLLVSRLNKDIEGVKAYEEFQSLQ